MATAAKNEADAQYVYRFGGGVSDGGSGDKNLLGGKGANLAEMASIGLPVPPGFTISTAMCTRYYEEGETFPDSVRRELRAFRNHRGHPCEPRASPETPMPRDTGSGCGEPHR